MPPSICAPKVRVLSHVAGVAGGAAAGAVVGAGCVPAGAADAGVAGAAGPTAAGAVWAAAGWPSAQRQTVTIAEEASQASRRAERGDFILDFSGASSFWLGSEAVGVSR
jgi:hypothetical protein